jgi:hypothetical protein
VDIVEIRKIIPQEITHLPTKSDGFLLNFHHSINFPPFLYYTNVN